MSFDPQAVVSLSFNSRVHLYHSEEIPVRYFWHLVFTVEISNTVLFNVYESRKGVFTTLSSRVYAKANKHKLHKSKEEET